MPQDRTWTDTSARAALRSLFDTAIAAADPRTVLARHLPPKPIAGRCIVVGGGKSAAVMAAALEDAWPDVALEGTVVTRYGHAVPTRRIEVIEASHPVPDDNSERGARRLLERVQGLTKDDLVIALMSGGASALLAAPVARSDAGRQTGDQPRPAGLRGEHHGDERGSETSLGDQGRPPRRRRRTGARHDPGDQRCAGRRPGGDRLRPDRAGRHHLRRRPRADRAATASRPRRPSPPAWTQDDDETPKPGSLTNVEFRMIATPMMALDAMAADARTLGLHPMILGDALEGEASQMGTVMAGIARSVRHHGQPLRPPAVLLSGGETTVTMAGARHWQGRPEHHLPAGPRHRAGRRSRHLGNGRRHRRDRRHGRNRRRTADARHLVPRARQGHRCPRDVGAATTAMASSGRSGT